MKKFTLFLATVLMCIVSVFGFAACTVSISLDGSDSVSDFTADTKEGSFELLDDFFEETLDGLNATVTYKTDGELQYTEYVDGENSYFETKDGIKVYCFVKDGFYYQATDAQTTEEDGSVYAQRYYYTTDSANEEHYDSDAKSYYEQNHCFFMSDFEFLKIIPEEGGTFNAHTHIETKDSKTTASFTFDYSGAAGTSMGTLNVSATSEEGKVKQATITKNDLTETRSSVIVIDLVYGNAQVEIPDVAAWDREAAEEAARLAANETAIETRDEFFSETTSQSNIAVTVKVNDNPYYVESIADGLEKIVYPTCTVYTFSEETDDETNFYYVFDSEDSKYYLLNDNDVYDSSILVYYHNGIRVFDEFGTQGAAFECKVENDQLTFTVKLGEQTLATLTAVRENGKVVSATCVANSENGTSTTTYAFEYGTAVVEKPNIADYEDGSFRELDPDEE